MKLFNHFYLFYNYLISYNKIYDYETYYNKFFIFKDNLDFIEHINSQNKSFKLEINKYADLHHQEFKNKYLGLKPNEQKNSICKPFKSQYIDDIDLPEEFDWRNKSVLTDIKNQEQCGSCWAFACTETAESNYALVHNKLIELSPQELVDCVKSNEGCNGGMIDNTLTYIIKYGLETNKDYPYLAKDDSCKMKKTKYKPSACFDVEQNNEIQMKKALVENGPLVGCIEADSRIFQFYKHGVITSDSCGTNTNHAIQIVGYGTDEKTNIPYWVIRNSWGETWGENGFVKIERTDSKNIEGICGIATGVSGFYINKYMPSIGSLSID